jgi:hypothetical protein
MNASLVMHLNKQAVAFPDITAIPDETLELSSLARAMLFELSVARAEQRLVGQNLADWSDCLLVASSRQRRHFDAKVPESLSIVDIALAERAASNLVAMLHEIQRRNPGQELLISPQLEGYRWIASGNVDFAIGSNLIEVKHSSSNFSANDFRQVLMYWLLSYARAIEKDGLEFSDCILINPRRNSALALKFSTLARLSSSGLGKLELLRLFDSILGDIGTKL